jgi:hypothetical protein
VVFTDRSARGAHRSWLCGETCASPHNQDPRSKEQALFLSILAARCLLVSILAALGLLVGFDRNHLDGATGCLDFGASAGRKLMCPDREGVLDLAVAENLDQALTLRVTQETLFRQERRGNLSTSIKLGKVAKIDDGIDIAKRNIAIPQTAQEREALGEARLTAVKSAMDRSSGASFLAFGAAPGGFTATGAVPAAKPFFSFM